MNYADCIDLLQQIKTKEWAPKRWTAWLDEVTAAGETEKIAVERVIETLLERGTL